MKKLMCKIGLHYYKPFTRSGEINWMLFHLKGSRCVNCNKEKNLSMYN